MMFKNSVRVLSSNFSTCYKLLLYKVIIALIMTAVSAAIFLPNLLPVIADLRMLGVFDIIKDTFAKFSTFAQNQEVIKANFTDVIDLTKTVLGFHASKLINTYIGCGVVALLTYFFNLLADVPMGTVLYGATQYQAKYYFSSSLITKFKKSIKYALLSMAIFLPIDIIILGITALILFATNMFFYFAGFFATLVFIILFTLRLTFQAAWVPTIIAEDERGVVDAFKESLLIIGEKFFKIFSSMLVALFLMIALTGVLGILTFGVGFIFSTILGSVLFMSLRLVVYYTIKGKKYYVDYETIITPKKLQDKEQNFTFDLTDWYNKHNITVYFMEGHYERKRQYKWIFNRFW